jgi:antirestriction protein ArdC
MTYKQATEAGGHVRKGEKSCPVVFWRELEIQDKETSEEKKIPFMRFYWLFNTAQIDGLKEVPTVEQAAIPAAQIVAGYQNAPAIKHGMATAFYSPGEDAVGMPELARFNTEADYYATLFHELTHSTGHKSRLDRLTSTSFGTEEYSAEELVAELGSAFLCGHGGVERQLEVSAAYLQGWLKALQNDPKLIVKASAQAQKAADLILGVKPE